MYLITHIHFSYVQIIGLLKQKIESRLSKVSDLSSVVTDVEVFLVDRMENMNNKSRANSDFISLPSTSSKESFPRGKLRTAQIEFFKIHII